MTAKRASRRAAQREARGARGRPPAAAAEHAAPRRRSLVWLLVGAVIAAALALTFLVPRGGGQPGATRGAGSPAPAAAPVAIPDPSTDEMLAPAAAVIRKARAELVRQPSSAAAWGAFGAACDAHKLFDEAAVCYRQAHALAPAEFRWAYLLAVVEDFRGAGAAELVRLFERAIALNALYPPLYLRFGDALVRQGEIERARDAYARAIELDPAFARAQRGLGQVLLNLGDVPRAIEHLERAAGLEPDAVAYNALVRAYTLQGDAARAEEAARKAAEVPPQHGAPDPLRFEVERQAGTPLAARQRALDHMRESRFAAALPEVEFLVEVQPRQAIYRLWLANCRAGTGDPQGAERALEQALELDPELAPARARYGKLLDQSGRVEAALEQYLAAARLDPENTALLGDLALAHARLGQIPEAIEAFERAAALGRDDAELHHNWGVTLQRKGDMAAAARHLELALELGGENPGTLYSLGLALRALGRKEEAERHLRRSAELDPKGPAAEELRRAGGG